MSIFEFVLVMASLIMALGVTVLLRHVALIIRYRRSMTLDWVPLAWIAVLFLSTTAVWWSLWDFAEVAWTYPRFFYLLLIPTVQYIAISMFVSTEMSQHAVSLSDNYDLVRLPFMVLMVIYQLLNTWDGWVLDVEPLWNSLRVVQLVLIALYVVAAIWSNRLVQKIVVLLALGMFIVSTFVLRYLPGAFAVD